MANDKHLAKLTDGVEIWNRWREKNKDIKPDLSGADLSGANLSASQIERGAVMAGENLSQARLGGINLIEANLSGANLMEAYMMGANLSRANLTRANLEGAFLGGANLSKATLSFANLYTALLHGADLSGAELNRATLIGIHANGASLSGASLVGAALGGANLRHTDLKEAKLFGAYIRAVELCDADLRGAILDGATLIDTDCRGADLRKCHIYGISAWDLKLDDKTKQGSMIITPYDQPAITVDDLEVAQFVYLLINNRKVRDVINTITSKAVLILGRFYDERKRVLDALQDELRKRDWVPIIFDFEPSHNRDLTETVQLLANMSRFVIADVTDAKSLPQELSHIIPFFPSVPVQPILLEGEREYAMFEHWEKYNSVLPVYYYEHKEHLIENMETAILGPVENWKLGRDEVEELKSENEKLKEELRRLKKVLLE